MRAVLSFECLSKHGPLVVTDIGNNKIIGSYVSSFAILKANARLSEGWDIDTTNTFYAQMSKLLPNATVAEG